MIYLGEASRGFNQAGDETWAFLARAGPGKPVAVYQCPAAGIASKADLLRALRDDPGVARPMDGLPTVSVLRGGADA